MRILHSNLLCLTTLLLAACPGDDTSGEEGPSADSGASGSTTEPSVTSTESGSATEPGPTSTTESGSATEPGTSADTGTTGPGSLSCGDVDCGESEWCDWSDGVCGVDGFGMSMCEPRPKGCGEDYAPVCGCDGQVHSNACSATMAGVDLNAEGDCPTPEGYFRCGSVFCDAQFQYCQVQLSDIGGFGHSYACMSPAVECIEGITCDCLTEEFCFDFGCNATPDGGVEIECPGG
jgi:hypothetical protein